MELTPRQQALRDRIRRQLDQSPAEKPLGPGLYGPFFAASAPLPATYDPNPQPGRISNGRLVFDVTPPAEN